MVPRELGAFIAQVLSMTGAPEGCESAVVLPSSTRTPPTSSALREPVMRFRLRVRDFGEHRFEFPSAALFGAPLEILRGRQGSQFLPDGRINELVDGHTFSLGEFL